MRKRLASAVVVALVVIISSVAAAAPAFETVVPEDTLAFVTIRDVPALQAKIKSYSLYDLWMEPAVQRFLEKPIQRLKEEIGEAEGKAGVKLEEVWSLFHGQVALHVSMDAMAGNPMMVLMADVGQDGEKAMKLVATIVDKAAEEAEFTGIRRVEETHEGARLVALHAATEGEGVGGEPGLTYGVAGDVFIVGAPLAAVKRTVSFLNNPPPTALAESAVYTSTVNKTSPNADVAAFVDLSRILGIVNLRAQGTPVPQILDGLGLNNLVSAGIALEMGDEEATSRLFLQNTGVPQGIVKLLMPAPGPLYSAAEAPDDASQFVSFRMDLTAIWDEVERILATAAPQALVAINAQLNVLAEQLGQPFDLRQDILSVFGPRMALYSRFERPLDPRTSQQTVILQEISSKAAFDQALDKLQKLAPPLFAMVQPQEYMGHQVYVFSMPTPPNMPPGAAMPEGMPQPAFVATEKQFVFSNRVDALKAHLRRQGKAGPSLQDRVEFQQGRQRLPTDGQVMISFQDPSPQVELFVTALKGGQLSPILDRFRGDPDIAEVLDLFDFSLLPEPGEITKHLTTTSGCAVVEPAGLLVISRSPARPVAKE